MATPNPFDQFDDPIPTDASGTPLANPFNQFDEEPAAGQVGPGASSTAIVEVIRTLGQGIAAEVGAGLTMGASALQASKGGGARRDLAETVELGEQVRESIQFEPQTESGKTAVRGLGKLAEVITAGVRKPFAGLAGIFNLPGGIEQAVGAVERVETEGVGSVLADALFEATGSPAVAAVAKTLPEGVATVLGTKGAGRAVKAVDNVPRGTSAVKPTIASKADEIVDIPPTTVEQAGTIAKDVRRGKAASVAEEVRPDPKIVAAADELGVDLPASATSTNRAFQELEQAVKSQPGSRIAAKETEAIKRINQKADELIDDLGGTTDKSLLDDTVRNDFLNTIDEMETQASAAYKIVDDTIPKNHRIDLRATDNGVKKYLDDVLEEFGGDESLLNSVEKRLFVLTRKRRPNPKKGQSKFLARRPTYAALDRIRRDVGRGFNGREGPFRSDEIATLKRVYAALSEEQQLVAKAFDIGGDYARARGLVNKRKIIEGQAQKILGRDLNNSIVPKLRIAATGLTKGDVSKFNVLMESVPPGLRGEVAATMLGDIFAAGSRSGVGGGFVKTFELMNRNTRAKKILFEHLPRGAERRFDMIGRVSTGLFRAKALENSSRTARAILQALDDGGMIEKLYGVGKKVAAAEAVTTVSGAPFVGSAAVMGATLAKKSTPAIVAADEFLTSQAFARSVRLSGSGKTKLAEDIVTKSPKFQKWLKLADEKSAGEIARLGFITWLTGEDK